MQEETRERDGEERDVERLRLEERKMKFDSLNDITFQPTAASIIRLTPVTSAFTSE